MKALPGKPGWFEGSAEEFIESTFSKKDEFQRELARLVSKQRKRRRWSQEQLAKRAELSVRTIRQVEDGFGNRLTLRAGFRLFQLLGLRLRCYAIERPTAKESAQMERLVRRGEKYLADLMKRIPPRKLQGLLCTANEFEFLFEAVRLLVGEGW